MSCKLPLLGKIRKKIASSGKNKKNIIYLSSAEFIQGVFKAKSKELAGLVHWL